MNAHVLLNILNELGEKNKMRDYAEHLIGFPNSFNKFNNTGARVQDSIYHMTLKSHFIRKFCMETLRFRQSKTRRFYGRQRITLRRTTRTLHI